MSKSYFFLGGSLNGKYIALYEAPLEYRVAVTLPATFDFIMFESPPDLDSLVVYKVEIYKLDNQSQSYIYDRTEDINIG